MKESAQEHLESTNARENSGPKQHTRRYQEKVPVAEAALLKGSFLSTC